MATRPLWKGQLRLSLVSLAVELHSATKTGSRVSFRQIHEPSGKRIRYEKVVPGIGVVDKDDIKKGYELKKDSYILLDAKEIDAVKLESKKTFELIQFVGACEIPPLYFDRPYYLVPADKLAEDAYRVIREALRAAEKIGLGQITLRGQEYIAAVKPCGDGLLLETLHYEDEIRSADPLFNDISDKDVPSDMLEVAETLIEKKTAPFDISRFKDNYIIALRELIERKTKSKTTKPDAMRMNEKAVEFVKEFFKQSKPVAAICHAAWMLVEADVVDGRTLTSYPSLKTDIENAGGIWVDKEVCVDDGLITSRKPEDLKAFCTKAVEEFAEGVHKKRGADAR